MDIPIFDIDYNEHTGYYNIVDSDGNRYGEYLKYDDANNALQKGSFEYSEQDDTEIDLSDYEEYVVCREYISHRQHYVMFTRGKLSDHVSYPESSLTFRSGFNDTSIKIYHSKEQAVNVARKFNEISKEKGLWKYANWKAMAKWW